MNQQFLKISFILSEARLSPYEKKKLQKLSVKLAWKGIHKILDQKKKKKTKKKIENDADRIYKKLVKKAEKEAHEPLFENDLYHDPLLSLQKIKSEIYPELHSSMDKGLKSIIKLSGATKIRYDKQADDIGAYIEIDKNTKERILVLPENPKKFAISLGLYGVSPKPEKYPLPVGNIQDR